MTNDNKRIVFFGAGEASEFALSYANIRKLEVDCFVDNDPAKWGSKMYGLEVLPPEHLMKYNAGEIEIMVTVGPGEQEKIMGQLSAMGFWYGETVSTCHEKSQGDTLPRIAVTGHMPASEKGLTLMKKPLADCPIFVDDAKEYVYRVVSHDKCEQVRSMYECIESNESLRKMMVPTQIAGGDRWGRLSPLALKHKYLSPISYVPEWPFAMVRDYVLFMVDLLSRLDEAGLGLRDFGSLNTVFHGGGFVYIDYTGMSLQKTYPIIIQRFMETHINPLLLMSKAQGKGYLYLKNPVYLLKYNDFSGYLNDAEKTAYLTARDKCLELSAKGSVSECCALLKDYIKTDVPKRSGLTDWDGYQSGLWRNMGNPDNWTPKQHAVIKLARRTSAGTMMDLAGNEGWYCFAMADALKYAITADVDPGAADKAYEKVVDSGTGNIIPLMFDLTMPLPAFAGGRNSLSCTYDAAIRLKCDLVLALAIVHHLTLSQGLCFDETVAQLAMYTNKHMIVEFCDRDDTWVAPILKQYPKEHVKWYTKNNFELALGKTFNIVETIPSETDTRILYLCEKK